jgi:hypothetical protein
MKSNFSSFNPKQASSVLQNPAVAVMGPGFAPERRFNKFKQDSLDKATAHTQFGLYTKKIGFPTEVSSFEAKQTLSQIDSSVRVSLGPAFNSDSKYDRFKVHSMSKQNMAKVFGEETKKIGYSDPISTLGAKNVNSTYLNAEVPLFGASFDPVKKYDKFKQHSLDKEILAKTFGTETKNLGYRVHKSTFEPKQAESQRQNAAITTMGPGYSADLTFNKFKAVSIGKGREKDNYCKETQNVGFSRSLLSSVDSKQVISTYKKPPIATLGNAFDGARKYDKFKADSLPKAALSKTFGTETSHLGFHAGIDSGSTFLDSRGGFSMGPVTADARKQLTNDEVLNDYLWRRHVTEELKAGVMSGGMERQAAENQRRVELAQGMQRSREEKLRGVWFGPARWSLKQVQSRILEKMRQYSKGQKSELSLTGVKQILGLPPGSTGGGVISAQKFSDLMDRWLQLTNAEAGVLLEYYGGTAQAGLRLKAFLEMLEIPMGGGHPNRHEKSFQGQTSNQADSSRDVKEAQPWFLDAHDKIHHQQLATQHEAYKQQQALEQMMQAAQQSKTHGSLRMPQFLQDALDIKVQTDKQDARQAAMKAQQLDRRKQAEKAHNARCYARATMNQDGRPSTSGSTGRDDEMEIRITRPAMELVDRPATASPLSSRLSGRRSVLAVPAAPMHMQVLNSPIKSTQGGAFGFDAERPMTGAERPRTGAERPRTGAERPMTSKETGEAERPRTGAGGRLLMKEAAMKGEKRGSTASGGKSGKAVVAPWARVQTADRKKEAKEQDSRERGVKKATWQKVVGFADSISHWVAVYDDEDGEEVPVEEGKEDDEEEGAAGDTEGAEDGDGDEAEGGDSDDGDGEAAGGMRAPAQVLVIEQEPTEEVTGEKNGELDYFVVGSSVVNSTDGIWLVEEPTD